MIKSDFHVHTSFSTDSDTPAKEQIEALINKGITEICITDHHDIGYTAMEKADVNTSESTNTSIESDRKSTRLNSSHKHRSRMPSSA